MPLFILLSAENCLSCRRQRRTLAWNHIPNALLSGRQNKEVYSRKQAAPRSTNFLRLRIWTHTSPSRLFPLPFMPLRRHIIYAYPGNIVNISILSSLLPSVFSDFCVTRKPISAAKKPTTTLVCSGASECLIWTPCFFEWSPPLHKIILHKKTLYAIRNIRRHTQRMIAPPPKKHHP